MIVDTPRGLQPLHPGVKIPLDDAPQGSSTQAQAESNATAQNLELRKTIYQSTFRGAQPVSEAQAASLAAHTDAEGSATASGGERPRYACNTCGTDCTRQRYQAINVKDFVVCPNCYSEGRFPSSMFSGDFIRMDGLDYKHGGANAEDPEEWSDEETLRLLEGLEMFDDDWTAVADHVRTRSREQCIMKFVQMPIEDPYLDGGASKTNSNGVANGSAQGIAMRDLGPLQYVRDPKLGVPFAQADNPVMSVVAFLASAVSPAVAAAAAQSALGELTDGLKRKQKAKDAEGSKDKEAAAGTEGAEASNDAAAAADADKDAEAKDGMDVDKPSEETAAPAANLSEPTANGEPSTPKPPSGEVTISITDAAKSALAQAKENDEGEGASSKKADVPPEAVPKNAVEKAAAIALGAAAAKAHILSTYEERECQRLVSAVVEAQMRKLELKMARFEEMEVMLEAERRTIEAGRKQLYHDRLAVQRQLAAVNDLLRKATTAPQSVSPVKMEAASSAANGVPGQGPVVREAPGVAPPQGGSIANIG